MSLESILNQIYDEITFEVARSSGAGGQNVNKVNSKVILRWNLLSSTLAPHIQERLLSKLRSRLTSAGYIVISSERFRDQPANKRDCIEKLQALVAEGLRVEAPRKKTKPTKASKRKRLETKRRHQEKKLSRKRIDH